jgi:hypothetical protein
VTGHLAGTIPGGEGDDELVALDPDPHSLAGELVRHRVAGRAEAERRVVVDDAGDAERDRMRLGRDRVQAPALGS